jgi:integrase
VGSSFEESKLASQKKIAVDGYKGVRYVIGEGVNGKPEKIYYIRYKRNGKSIEEKAGRQFKDNMTPAKASRIRVMRINGELSNAEKRELEKTKQDPWTFNRLWQSYSEYKGSYKTKITDTGNYKKHIESAIGTKEPKDLVPLDLDRLRRNLSKNNGLAPQTIKHVLALIKRLSNYAYKKNLCSSLSFQVELPKVDNQKTEDLTSEQLKSLLEVLEREPNLQVKNLMLLALFTGMRRGELFELQWADIDFEKGFILIREPKGGVSQKIPLNDEARRILEQHEQPFPDSPYIFPGRNGSKRKEIKRPINRIKKEAGLPIDFRPLHGLRHVFASMIASSGKVDMYTLQKLLTHKSPMMTQRYAHLRDESLKQASDVASDMIGQIQNQKPRKKIESN